MPPPQPPPPEPPKPGLPLPTPEEEPRGLQSDVNEINEWAQRKQILGQVLANNIRNYLKDLCLEKINWSVLGIYPKSAFAKNTIDISWFSLGDNAKGEGNVAKTMTPIKLFHNVKNENRSKIFNEILALVRFNHYKKQSENREMLNYKEFIRDTDDIYRLWCRLYPEVIDRIEIKNCEEIKSILKVIKRSSDLLITNAKKETLEQFFESYCSEKKGRGDRFYRVRKFTRRKKLAGK